MRSTRWLAATTTRQMGLVGLGIEFAASVVGLALLGYWIDRHYGLFPWGTLVGSALGLIGGTYNFIRAALATAKSLRREPTAAERREREE